jgi:hypothetical protein
MSLAKKPSTALSQEADVGVKWKVQRGVFHCVVTLHTAITGFVE